MQALSELTMQVQQMIIMNDSLLPPHHVANNDEFGTVNKPQALKVIWAHCTIDPKILDRASQHAKF